MPVLSPRVRLLLGVVGSVSIAVGSLGVGWLGPSSALRGWLLFELLRNSRGAVTFCGLLVVVGAVLLLAAWVSLGMSLLERRSSRGSALPASAEALVDRGTDGRGGPDARRTAAQVREVAVAATAWSIPLLFALPLFSRDMFAYIGQGRLMAAGLNPYSTGMAELPGWFGLGVDPLWADTQTPYGPVFVWIERLVVMSTDALPPEIALFAFRFIAAAGLAMLAFYAWRIARLRGLNQAGVLWVVAASPLVIMNFVVAGHNDSLMLAFVVAGVYYALKDRPILGTLLVAVAIGVKPIAVIALPIIGLIWAGSNAGWGAIIRRWAAVAAVGLGTVVLLGWGIGVGVGWIGALITPVTISSWYAPANILGISIGGLANGLGLDGDLAQTIVKLVLLAAGCAAAGYLVITKRRADPLLLLGACFAAITLASPVIHPWYGLWLLTLLALIGVDRVWRIRAVLYSTAFFMLIGLTEPLDLIPRLDTDTMIPVAVIGTAVVGVAAVLVSAELVTRRTVAVRGLRVPVNAPSTPSP